MNAIELLTHRRSAKKLGLPGPSAEQIQTMLQAATQAPDHGLHTPWRFVLIEGAAAQERLHGVLLQAARELDMGERGEQKARQLSQMAPLMVGVIAAVRSPDAGSGGWAAPAWEQHASAASATYALQLAAQAQGLGSVWITGAWVDSAALRQAFECAPADKVMALLAIGTPQEGGEQTPKNTDLAPFVRRW